MENFYIHVGLGRTGTTFLQEKIFSAHSQIHYHGKTLNAYPDWLVKFHYWDDFAFEKGCEEILQEIKLKYVPGKTNLISSEAFTQNGGQEYAQANRIFRIIPNAKILLVLRDPVEFVRSRYRVGVDLENFILPLEDLLDWSRTPLVFYKRKPIYLPSLFYDEIIETYSNLFGRNRLCILKYEDMVEKPEVYFSTMASFLGINFDAKQLKSLLKIKINESRQKENLIHLRMENMIQAWTKYLGKGENEIKEVIVRYFLPNFDSEIIKPDLRKRLEKFFQGKCYGYY